MPLHYVVPALAAIAFSHFFDNVSTSAIENFACGWFDAMYTRFAVSLMHMCAWGVVVIEGAAFAGFDFSDVWTQLLACMTLVGGLALQSSLSNVAAGVQLIFTRPFEVGDSISVAGVTGTVTRLDFFHTRLVTTDNEGINVPNSAILGGALQNNSDNYEHVDACGLRVVRVALRIPVQSDLEKAEEALKKAAKDCDAFIAGLNSDKSPHNFSNGTHTLAEYHKIKYGKELCDEQANNSSGVHLGGQILGLNSTGFDLTLYCYADNILYHTVKQHAFRTAVKYLKEASISLS